MNLCALRSSSSGNAALVFNDTTKILVDCGISYKKAVGCLSDIDISPEEINAIVVTHEHSDHISGVGVFCRKHKIPIYATAGTWFGMENAIGTIPEECVKVFGENKSFHVKDFEVRPFNTSHDAAQPVGYSFLSEDDKISIMTDTGYISDEMFECIKSSKAVLLESNHDINMLGMGRYPLPVKKRIRSSIGHLSNDDAAKTAVDLCESGTKHIILGHLSRENNYPPLAYNTVKNALMSIGALINYDIILDIASCDATGKIFKAV